MPRQAKDLTNRRFGKLKILSRAVSNAYSSGYKETMWLCKCDCGKETTVRAKCLVKRSTQSCGCSQQNVIKFLGNEASFRCLYQEYIGNARARKLIFSLMIEEFHSLTSSDCRYCGSPPSKNARARKGTKIPYVYNGIDRINNELGYITENCVPCCYVCNLMKRGVTEKDFKNHVVKIYKHTNMEDCMDMQAPEKFATVSEVNQ